MAKLKDIKGSAIQYLAEDPVEYAGTWSSGGNLNTARQAVTGFGATNSAAIAAGGYTGTAYTGATELYNGTSWSEVNDMNTSRGYGGAGGTTTAGFFAGGHPGSGAVTNNETWDGTSWTEANDLSSIRSEHRGSGTSTSGIIAGGYTAPYATVSGLCELWDGTNWTEVNDLNSPGLGRTIAGVSTAAIVNSDTPGSNNSTELWDGTNWTTSTASNSFHRDGGGSGTSTNAIFSVGGPPGTTNVEVWDGSGWTEVNNVSTARFQVGATVGQVSNSDTQVIYGGQTDTPTIQSATEEWAFPPSTSSIVQEGQLWFNSTTSVLKGYGKAAGIPAATWSSGTALNTARYGGSGLGTAADSGLVAGSNPAGDLVEQYNGTSWTEVAEFNTARRINATGFGSVTAGLIMGGLAGPLSALTESWNGSAWTEVNDLNTGRASYATSSGSPYTSGFIAGGHVAPAYSALGETELWDGTSWTETTNLNTSRVGTAGAGVSSTSGLAFGGVPNRAINESWNGSAWTEVGDMNTGREYVQGAGVQSSAIVFAGRTNPPQSIKANTESWNGSSWTEVNDLSTSRFQGMSGGVAISGFYAGGEAPGASSATEEFEADATVSTVTTS